MEPSTRKATDRADESSATAVKEFGGWDTAAGLKKVTETWDKQVKVLMGRLSTGKNSLRGASTLFSGNELEINSQFSPPSSGPSGDRTPPVSKGCSTRCVRGCGEEGVRPRRRRTILDGADRGENQAGKYLTDTTN